MDLRSHILPPRDRLYRLALGITLHTAEAEDVVQETMIRAWERREEWPTIQNMASWLGQICRNIALDKVRKTATTPTQASISPTTNKPIEHKSDEDLSANLEAKDTLNHVLQLAAQLPPPQDDIFRLRDIEGYTYREIAQQLQITEDQVRVYLHRARTRLRQLLHT